MVVLSETERRRDKTYQTYMQKVCDFSCHSGLFRVVGGVRADGLIACVVHSVVSLPYRSRLIFPQQLFHWATSDLKHVWF